jgi:hypothetical protein
MTLRTPLVRLPVAGCLVPVDRRQRMSESVSLAGRLIEPLAELLDDLAQFCRVLFDAPSRFF